MLLSELFHRVGEVWKFDSENYPRQPAGPDDRHLFATAHVCQHVAKTGGKLNALFEPMAHGGEAPDPDEVARQAAYSIINALRLAGLGGATPAQVIDHIEKWERENS